MEYYNKLLCVTFEELTGGDDPVILRDTLRTNIRRGNIQSARQGKGEGNYALYVYDSIPKKYREKFEARYGDPRLQLERMELMDYMQLDEEARRFYELFEYDLNGVQTRLSAKLIDEYTKNASVAKMLIERMNELQATTHALGGGRRNDLWDIVYKQSEKLRELFEHTLPKNLARLKSKLAAFKKDGYGSLISGKVGNQNTLKITEEAGRRLIALKRSRVPVLTDSQIFERFNAECGRYGWKPLKSLSGMKAWLNSASVRPMWYDAVFGEHKSHALFDRRHKTELPQMRDALWYGDGTKLNLYYKDDEGKVRTTGVYEVIDAYSECLLGFCISDSEDYEAQYLSYRMAIQVSGHKPYEIVYDNQGGHKKLSSQKFFSKLCVKHRPTTPYNGSSKTIENLFYRLQNQVLHKEWNFTGQNVTTKKEVSRPNLEFIEANKDRLPTLDELKAMYVEFRKEWNEKLHPATGKRRIDMYEQSVNAATPVVTVSDMVEMFWVECDRMSTFTSSGIDITVKGVKRSYEVMSSPGVPDLEWRRRHTYEKFVVKYDPYDFTSIRLYRKDKAGELRFERVAEPYLVIHRARQEQTEAEALFIRQQREADERSRADRLVEARNLEYDEGVAPEQHGLKTPDLKGLSKDMQRQIDRRVRKYRGQPEELSIGKVTKKVSNIDWREECTMLEFDDAKTLSKT